ncbi:MAG: arsenic resistance N-acetyltransferase ArsN2 [Planctomycetota bacterium]
MTEVQYRFADPADEGRIVALLSECDLPPCDMGCHISNFILAEINQQVGGVVGLETCDDSALLRSLAVRKEHRGRSIGAGLLKRIVSYAQFQRIKTLFLLTMDADDFFRRHGFVQVSRKDVPQSIQKTAEFKHVCPVSAICMSRRMKSSTIPRTFFGSRKMSLEQGCGQCRWRRPCSPILRWNPTAGLIHTLMRVSR